MAKKIKNPVHVSKELFEKIEKRSSAQREAFTAWAEMAFTDSFDIGNEIIDNFFVKTKEFWYEDEVADSAKGKKKKASAGKVSEAPAGA